MRYGWRDAVVLAALVVGLASCDAGVEELGLEGEACPCAEGWYCCEESQMCVESSASCEGAFVDAGTGFDVDADTDQPWEPPPDGGMLTPRALAGGQGQPGSILAADDRLTWVNEASGDIMHADYEGAGSPPDPEVLAGGAPGRIVLSSPARNSRLFWASRDAGALYTLVSGGTTALATDLAEPVDVVATESAVYWIVAGDTEDGGALLRVPAEGGEPEVLADGLAGPVALALSESFAFVALDPGAASEGSIVRVPRSGGDPRTLASGQSHPLDIAVGFEGAHLYWLNAGDGDDGGTVMRRTLPGTEAEIVAEGVDRPRAVASGLAGNFFLADSGVYRLDGQGGSEKLAPLEPADRRGFAVNAFGRFAVFWTNADEGTVVELDLDVR